MEQKLIVSNTISVVIVTVLCTYVVMKLKWSELKLILIPPKNFFSTIDVLVNISFISVVPENVLNSQQAAETMAASFFRKLFGESEIAVRIFTFLIVLSLIGTAASNIWR